MNFNHAFDHPSSHHGRGGFYTAVINSHMYDLNSMIPCCSHRRASRSQSLLESPLFYPKKPGPRPAFTQSRGLCKAFTMQGIKCCTVDRRLCVYTSDNNAVSYIGPSFNYTEAFSLLLLTMVTRTGLQEALKNRVKLVTFRTALSTA